jgi:hypothetical protein
MVMNAKIPTAIEIVVGIHQLQHAHAHVVLQRTINHKHCRPTVWTWRALSLEFARRREGFGGMPIASFFRVVDISFEYRGDAVP